MMPANTFADHQTNEPPPPPRALCDALFCCCVHQTAVEGSNLFGQGNTNYPILETYAEGSVMEVKVVVSTYHWVSFKALFQLHAVNRA